VIYYDDHEPGHVHVKKAGTEVVINLGDARTAPFERENKGMSQTNRRRALQIAAVQQDYLIEQWGELNGNA
jgi:chaperone required for assembly of F1-ATPase